MTGPGRVPCMFAYEPGTEEYRECEMVWGLRWRKGGKWRCTWERSKRLNKAAKSDQSCKDAVNKKTNIYLNNSYTQDDVSSSIRFHLSFGNTQQWNVCVCACVCASEAKPSEQMADVLIPTASPWGCWVMGKRVLLSAKMLSDRRVGALLPWRRRRPPVPQCGHLCDCPGLCLVFVEWNTTHRPPPPERPLKSTLRPRDDVQLYVNADAGRTQVALSGGLGIARNLYVDSNQKFILQVQYGGENMIQTQFTWCR